MKSKKFNAAEKYFLKKELQYKKQIKLLKEQLDSAYEDALLFKKRSELAEKKNDELKNWLERLLEYTELSKDDIKQVCDKDKKMAETIECFEKWANFSRYWEK